MKTTKIEFTRITNDINGNPRYVCHFLNLVNDNDEKEVREDFAATLAQNSFKFTSLLYERAIWKAKKIGGRKYTAKSYGGGVVFQSYNIADLEKSILELTQ